MRAISWQQLLNAIASKEAPSYNTLYGGGKFADFQAHPNQHIKIRSGPNKGRTSTAAGRYQFLKRTWDEMARKTGTQDFSPESQDRNAQALAAERYKKNTGENIETAMQRGDWDKIQSALAGTWTSLKGGIEATHSGDSFQQAGGGGTINPQAQAVNVQPASVVAPAARRAAPGPIYRRGSSMYDDGSQELGNSPFARAPAMQRSMRHAAATAPVPMTRPDVPRSPLDVAPNNGLRSAVPRSPWDTAPDQGITSAFRMDTQEDPIQQQINIMREKANHSSLLSSRLMSDGMKMGDMLGTPSVGKVENRFGTPGGLVNGDTFGGNQMGGNTYGGMKFGGKGGAS